MSIESRDYDFWNSTIEGLPCGLYFYFMNENTGEFEGDIDSRIIGNCEAIQSVQYVPFITDEDLILNKIKYDVNRFGDGTTFSQKFNSLEQLYVHRIKTQSIYLKDVGEFKCYEPEKSIGGDTVNWRNESRLYNYPYMFGYITDHLNPPMEIKYHLCPNNDTTLRVRTTISDRCSYALYIEGYKGDNNGNLEAMVSGDAHELPCSSDQYNSWMARNKNQMAQNIANIQNTTMLQNQGVKLNQEKQEWLNPVQGLGNIPAILNGGLGELGSAIVNSFYLGRETDLTIQQNNQNVQNAQAMALATSNDMKSIPNTMISMGSDVYYGLANGQFRVCLYRMGLHEEVYQRLGDYFHMYGYKQNKVLPIFNMTRSRYYFNYIKTIGCNITGDIPRKYLNKLKSIFDNGVTLWHADRDIIIQEYAQGDNYEV